MVLPIHDDNSDRTIFPWLNIALIVVNIVIFVFLQGMGQNDDFTLAYSVVPAEIISGEDYQTEDRVFEIATSQGQMQVRQPGLKSTPIPVYLTLITAMFMHGSVAHLLGNMWFLWIFGDNLENAMGRGRYLVFYLLTGLIGSLVHVAVSRLGESALIPSLGASGAISGVMGGYVLLHPQRRVTVLLLRIVTEVPAYVAVGIWFLFQVVSGLGLLGSSEGGVAYGAHVGGFIAGLVLAKPFVFGREQSVDRSWHRTRSYRR
ncbi:rhomboid family intramembrane serine protease [Rhodopirellula sp. MGV]|uniref:rhomboid family intramembrane serine protease n=1 Tax=Rhodopirellula sp. MGV TaxID=2023130 RepID=UPI000B9781D4|nr:rhomboid family intramembrane serine protease [Rhodopirellula sp. MGV]OYP32237.1 rhomboid family intramembrane serine protease [Rhodopirellula sp. MGV]PNY35979.1 rhomboid family intramembrane serine protease [Rhodopirellula baltica]PNY36061.1 rhomboid family intramembrane serine protease [Rhodopirellula baltica]